MKHLWVLCLLVSTVGCSARRPLALHLAQAPALQFQAPELPFPLPGIPVPKLNHFCDDNNYGGGQDEPIKCAPVVDCEGPVLWDIDRPRCTKKT